MARGPIAVIGAGAAGTMAAIFAASAGAETLLLESTADGGRKILISGGGRCNILPACMDETRFVTDSSPHTLRKLLRSWPLAEQIAFFERDLGLPLVEEPESAKLFPASNRARDVRDGLLALAVRRGARFVPRSRVTGLAPAGGRWHVERAGAPALDVAAVIVATGGLSVPSTGSDGGGLRMLAALGHAVHAPYAALTPILAAAAPARLRVQWTAHDDDAWDAALRADGARTVAGVLRRELPARLADALIALADVDPACPLAELARPARRRLVETLVRGELPWSGHAGYAKAEVTGGGVALAEVDPRTLESRMHARLFVCGEVLDAFGPIGGYNFAWAWATGRAAGLGAARTLLA